MDNTRDDEGSEAPEEVPSDVEAARHQIEETRAEMSETIDAIEEKLSVERIQGRLQAAVRDATIGKVQQAVEGVRGRAREAFQLLSGVVMEHRREVIALGAGLGGTAVLGVALARRQRSGAEPMPPKSASTVQMTKSVARTSRDKIADAAQQIGKFVGRAPSEPPKAPVNRPALAAAVAVLLGVAGVAAWWLRRRVQGPAE